MVWDNDENTSTLFDNLDEKFIHFNGLWVAKAFFMQNIIELRISTSVSLNL